MSTLRHDGCRLPPGPREPRALATLEWMLRPGPMLERCRERYGDMFTLKIAYAGDWVFVSDPDAVKQVFTADPSRLHAGEANDVLRPVLGGHSVLLLDDEAHLRQRKLLLPPFHGHRMQAYRELMASVAAREVERWPVGTPLRLWDRMQAITLEIILRAVLGIEEPRRLELFRDRITTMIAWLMRTRQMLTLAVLGPRVVETRQLFRRVLGPLDELLLDEIRRRRTDASGREDILSLLVQARDADGQPMSDAELRDELMTLLMAGHETTATTLAWALERLVRHPPILQRLAEEATNGDERYADAVAKEAMRLRPVTPVVVRRLLEPMQIGGYRLPAGVLVAPCVYLVHRHPDVYPQPERFRPERFLERSPGTYTWLPFGGGVRRCLGASFALAEMQIVLSVIASRVSLRPARAAPERIRRRAVTLAPGRGAEAIVVAHRAGAPPVHRRPAGQVRAHRSADDPAACPVAGHARRSARP